MIPILFVCSGNTCRSPMAAAFFNARAEADAPSSGLRAESAGIAAVPGAPATAPAIQAAAERGVDLSRHRARCLDESLWKQASLVLCLSSTHLRFLRGWAVKGAPVPRLYGEYLSLKGSPEVPDPYGGTLAVYRTVATLLWDWSPLLLDLQARKEQGT